MFLVGYLVLQADIFYLMRFKTLIRISSTPRGDYHKPGLYPVIEDVIANDGGGGRAYREALLARYEASPLFRGMLVRLGFFWSVPCLVVAAACTAVIFTTPYPVAYAVGTYLSALDLKWMMLICSGWSIPGIWAAIWTFITIRWVQSCLRNEKDSWSKERVGVA